MNEKRELVDPQLPLALLRAVRRQDTPAELLPDEDPEQSFPHRLGLSDVVERQIREFERLVRRRRNVEAPQVEALLRLIARRPDAETVFDAAGRSLARLTLQGAGRVRRLARHLPSPIRYRAAARALRSAHGSVLIAARATVHHSPFELRTDDALTARADPHGTACRLYGALATAVMELHGTEPGTVVHFACEARGDDSCVWQTATPAIEARSAE
jgi:hypothetical protein